MKQLAQFIIVIVVFDFSAKCYKSKAVNLSDTTRCASEKVEAVTSLDILYNDFHNNVFEIMQDTDMPLSCLDTYPCPDGEPGCMTRCVGFLCVF